MTWKNSTFFVGFSWLIWGALFLDYPDWDVGVSVVMAVSTYFTADLVWQILRARKYRLMPMAAMSTYWCVDGSYWAYWSLVDPSVMIREGQWPMSLCLFLLCGAVWSIVPAQQSLLDTAKLGLQLIKTRWSSAFTDNT